MSKLCYHRYFDGIYLLTCGKPRGHEGEHVDLDGVIKWLTEQGFFDDYRD